jgi:Na+/melibiose symporter-like transporter
MHGIVQAFGIILFLIGVFASMTAADSAGGWFAIITLGLPLIGTGALLFSFGTMVEHLAAIRRDQKRAADAMEAIWQRRQPDTTPPSA